MDLFTDNDLQTLKDLKETPPMFLKEEKDFFSQIDNTADGAAPEATPENVYRDLNTEQAKGNFTQAPPNTPFSTPQDAFNPFANTNGKRVNLEGVLPAKTGVMIIDNLLPLGFSMLLKLLFDVKVKKSQLQLTETEKKTVEPIIAECMKTINIDFSNPWVALTFALTTIYGSKAAELGFDAYEKKSEAKEKEPIISDNDPAPYGFDEAGNVKAPNGYNADGTIKKDKRGRPKKAK